MSGARRLPVRKGVIPAAMVQDGDDLRDPLVLERRYQTRYRNV